MKCPILLQSFPMIQKNHTSVAELDLFLVWHFLDQFQNLIEEKENAMDYGQEEWFLVTVLVFLLLGL